MVLVLFFLTVFFVTTTLVQAREEKSHGFCKIEGKNIILLSTPSNGSIRAEWKTTQRTLIMLDNKKVKIGTLEGKSLRITAEIRPSMDYYPSTPLSISLALICEEAIEIQAYSISKNEALHGPK